MLERGLLSECEIVHPFVDKLNTACIDEEWTSLPEGYREVVRCYLRERHPDSMPRYFIIGYATREEIDRLTEVRKRNLAELVAYLENLETPRTV